MQDIPIVIKDKKNLKNLMRPRETRGERAVSAQPRLVQSARKHQTITDTQRTQERNVRRGGKVRRSPVSGVVWWSQSVTG